MSLPQEFIDWITGEQAGQAQPVVGQQEAMTPAQQQALTSFLQYWGQPQGGAYQGTLPGTGALSSLGQTSLAGLEQWVMTMAGGGGGPEMPGQIGAPGVGQAGMQPYQQYLMKTLGEGPEDFEDYFQKAVSDPMMRQYEEEILPGIRREMAPAYWSSERLGMEERSREDLMQALTGERARLAYGAWGAAKDRALDATGLGIQAELGMGGLGQQQFGTQVGQALGFGGLGLQSAMMPGQAALAGLTGADWWQQQTVGGQQSQYAYWLYQQGVPYQQANMILSALGLEPYEPYAMIQPGQPGSTGLGGIYSGQVSYEI